MRKSMGRNRVLVICAVAVCAVAVVFVATGGAATSGTASRSVQPAAASSQLFQAKVAKVPARPELYEPGQLVVGLVPGSDADAAIASLEGMGFAQVEALLHEADGFGAMILATTGEGVEQGSDLALAAQSAELSVLR